MKYIFEWILPLIYGALFSLLHFIGVIPPMFGSMLVAHLICFMVFVACWIVVVVVAHFMKKRSA